jgi:hypothetical protein
MPPAMAVVLVLVLTGSCPLQWQCHRSRSLA